MLDSTTMKDDVSAPEEESYLAEALLIQQGMTYSGSRCRPLVRVRTVRDRFFSKVR